MTKSKNREHRTRTSLRAATLAVICVIPFFSRPDPIRHADLNNGGIWVTKNDTGLFGRFNKPATTLDAGSAPIASTQNFDLDTLQSGSAVVAWDKQAGELYAVDTDRGELRKDQQVHVASNASVAMNGGTLAIFDPTEGKVWATHFDPAEHTLTISGLAPTNKPIATVDKAATSTSKDAGVLAVSTTGHVFVVTANGKLISVAPSRGNGNSNGFDSPTTQTVATKGLAHPQITSIGDDPIVLDPSTGTTYLPGSNTQHIVPDPQAQLAGPAPKDEPLVIATTKTLLSLSLDGKRTDVLYNKANGVPAAPAWLSGCVHAAWGGTPGAYALSCAGKAATSPPGAVADSKQLLHPVFRVNRDAILLNDTTNGDVYDLQLQKKMDDSAWRSVSWSQNNAENEKNNNAQAPNDQPPVAKDDTFGARPNHVAVLHVLDNDSDPAGHLLAVSRVTDIDNPAVTPVISPDRQTVQVRLPTQGDLHFHYTVDDGHGHTAEAQVTVNARSSDQNGIPFLRDNAPTGAHEVAGGGRLTVPVLGDWRDPDSDPLILRSDVADSAANSGGVVSTTPDGRVQFTAPNTAGPHTITYHVFDGHAAANGSLNITVLSPTAKDTAPAVAEPDVALGLVGQPIVIRPLANDQPGVDPSTKNAVLTLAQDVPLVKGLDVRTDRTLGTVTVTATTAGSWELTYLAGFGYAPNAPGTIRVDAITSATGLRPVAMPDTATLYGQSPAIVDVLANDADPAGGLLTVTAVQFAAGSDATDQVQAGIVGGRWLRINPLVPQLSSNLLIDYTVSNGTDSASGEVSVTQLDPLTTDVPVTQDDHAVARAGDTVLIPVLDNDNDSSGTPLTLAADTAGTSGSGSLGVTSMAPGPTGSAYISGDSVRYVAPPADAVTQDRDVTFAYTAKTPTGQASTGHVTVTITAPPTPQTPNSPPVPRDIEARGIAGNTLTIVVPTSMVDPDGDSVTVTGIVTPPTLGRVMSIGAGAITYQSFPTATGTDTFTYRVSDQYGGSGQAAIRVSVVPPGDPQPPIAVDDVVTAAPDAIVAADVLSNDLIASGDKAAIEPLATLNSQLPAGSSLVSDKGPVQVRTPTGPAPIVVRYGLTDGLGTPSTATLTIRPVAGFNIPPIAEDSVATPGADLLTATADVASKISDPDGDHGSLTVTVLDDPKAAVNGSVVTLPMMSRPQTVVYQVRDAKGGVAAAAIHVPSAGGGALISKGATIALDKDSAKTVSIADYVTDPAHKPLHLVDSAQLWTATGTGGAGLSAALHGDKELTLTASAGYNGPGSVTFGVANGPINAADTQSAVITVPVQVGPATPVLRCPTAPLVIAEGGAPLSVDVTSLCHVWTATSMDPTTLTYTAAWAKQIGGVDLRGSGTRTLTVTASPNAKGDTSGSISVSAAGSAASTLNISVTAPGLPTMSPVVVDGVGAGGSVSVDLAGYVNSPLQRPSISVVKVTSNAGSAATATAKGSTVAISIAAGVGARTLTFAVVMTDVADKHRTTSGQITLHVLDVPGAPSMPTADAAGLSGAATVSWIAPTSNGAPIDSYEVNDGATSHPCAASPCLVTGLHNGQSYVFTVRAHNAKGWSAWSSASGAVRPDAIPNAVTGLTVASLRDGALTITWNAASTNGSAVTGYDVTWPSGHLTVSGTSAELTGLDNNVPIDVRVRALNAAGSGSDAVLRGAQSAGQPSPPQAVNLASSDSPDNTRNVTITWNPPANLNGPGPATYTVTRTGGSGDQKICTTQGYSCTNNVPYDGVVYGYAVSVANEAATREAATHSSMPTVSSALSTTMAPEQPVVHVIPVVAALPDYQAKIALDLGPARNPNPLTVYCLTGIWQGVQSCGSAQLMSTSAVTGFPMTVYGLRPEGREYIPARFNLIVCAGLLGGPSCSADLPVSAEVNQPPDWTYQKFNTCGLQSNTVIFGWKPNKQTSRDIVAYSLDSIQAGQITGIEGHFVPDDPSAPSYKLIEPADGGVTALQIDQIDSAGELAQYDGYISCPHAGAVPPTITTTSLPAGTLGQSYAATLSAISPSGQPISWSMLTPGTLPAGMSWTVNGKFAGIPDEVGTFSITVQATVNGLSSSKTFDLVIARIPGDINGDGKVDCADLALLSAKLNQPAPPSTPEDLNSDGVVNIQDLSILVSHWNGPPAPTPDPITGITPPC